MTRTYAQQNGALTRAIRSGDPRKVIAEVERAYAEFDAHGWPDGWHRWNVAQLDAQYAISNGGWQ